MANHHRAHKTLARSYLTYFICSVVGLFADTLIGFHIDVAYANEIAFVCFGVGAVLIGWAQYLSRNFGKEATLSQDPYFARGPYRYMRNPTHLGIVILVMGYTVVSGSLVFFGVTIIGYLISNKFFHRYESIVGETYGKTYQEYKARVPKIF